MEKESLDVGRSPIKLGIKKPRLGTFNTANSKMIHFLNTFRKVYAVPRVQGCICSNCKDMKKYGGPGRRKRGCVTRNCLSNSAYTKPTNVRRKMFLMCK